MRTHLSRQLVAVMARPENGMLRNMVKVVSKEIRPGWALPVIGQLETYEFYVSGYRIQYVVEEDRGETIIRMAIIDSPIH